MSLFHFVRIPTGFLWSTLGLELFKLYGMMKIASDVFLLVQRPAEDQPNEQEEGCWQPGTGPIQTGTFDIRVHDHRRNSSSAFRPFASDTTSERHISYSPEGSLLC